MPLERCGKNGDGWRYGKSGHCYTGKDAKRKAIKQGLAVNKGHWSDANFKITRADIKELLQDPDITPADLLLLAKIVDG